MKNSANKEMASLAIEIKGISKTFGRNAVLRNLDLQVFEEEFLTIFGPNGAGKTTLIKILATLARPDSGQVRILGLGLGVENNNIRRFIGVVMHNSLLYGELTGYENLAFYAKMFGVNPVSERVRQVAAQMGMTARLHQRVRTLSHGMQKRFSIARALLHDPPVLFLDEPESGLDQEALGMLENALVRRDGRRRTVLMTTHNVERGIALADRVAIIANGRISYIDDGKTLDMGSFREVYLRSTGTTL